LYHGFTVLTGAAVAIVAAMTSPHQASQINFSHDAARKPRRTQPNSIERTKSMAGSIFGALTSGCSSGASRNRAQARAA
jgi:hypothetical protein